MKNNIRDGKALPYTLGGTLSSGDVVVIGNRVGILSNDGVSGDIVSAEMEGAYECTKTTSQSWSVYDQIFWDTNTSKMTKTANSTSIFAGYALEAAGSNDETGKVMLCDPAPKAATVAALAQTISGSYTQSEVQAISTKVDAILTALKNAGLMA
jgi:predicted RecA/RadA family phage recombinase